MAVNRVCPIRRNITAVLLGIKMKNLGQPLYVHIYPRTFAKDEGGDAVRREAEAKGICRSQKIAER
jgi:hypothetical protein